MTVSLTRDGSFAVLTLNRPEALNALSFAIIRQIDQAVREVAQSDARGLIVTGAGPKSFCAGADIKELIGRGLQSQHEGARGGQLVFDRLAELRIPSVAVIHGYAFGGGLELALACTFRVGTAQAKLGLPEVKLGLIPGYGGTQRLPRLIGEGRALDIILSGRTVGAEEAERIGLLNRVMAGDDPVSLGKSYLEPMLQHGLGALQFARQAVQRGMQTTLEQGLRIECDLSTLAFQTEDAAEGMAAFAEKRNAQFKDR